MNTPESVLDDMFEAAPGSEPPRRRVLISAYHAAPGQGPEASAGWAFATAAARHHDVWLVTRPRFAEAIAAALVEDPQLSAAVQVSYLDLPERITRLKKHPRDLYWYYIGWQYALSRRAQDLHRQQHFDVAHHVTFANDWLPAGVTRLDGVPVVWGPVGGSTSVPAMRLRRWLGPRGTVTEIMRLVGTWVPRRLWGRQIAKRVDLVVAQNPEVAKRFSIARAVVMEPNAAFTQDDLNIPRANYHPEGGGQRVAVFAGRLVGWKGARLAIDVIAHPLCADWRLDIYGEGHDLSALRRQVTRLKIESRVRFLGHRPRPEILQAFAHADAFLFPSFHDQAGWVAGEASSLGCPVVCLPFGGPHVLAHTNAFVASSKGDIVKNLAEALRAAGEAECNPHERWSVARLPDLVDSWYQTVMTGRLEAGNRAS